MSKRRTDNLRAHLDAARTEAAALRVALERLTGATWAVLAAGTANVTTSEWTAMREACHDARELAAAPARAPGTGIEPTDEGRIYPCDDCGVMRTKAEGGTTFTVCDACWDKHHGKPATPGPLPVARLDPVTAENAAPPRPPSATSCFPLPAQPEAPVSGESATGSGAAAQKGGKRR